MVEVLRNVVKQLLGFKDDRTERHGLGSRRNTDSGKRRNPWTSCMLLGLVVVIGLVATSTDHIAIENKFLLGPNLQLFAIFDDP